MFTNIHQDKILILDFGSQYTQLIARRIREIGVYSEVWSASRAEDLAKIRALHPKGIILAGSPESLDSEAEQTKTALDKTFFQLPYPMLGICFGMQTMAAGVELVADRFEEPFGAQILQRVFSIAFAMMRCTKAKRTFHGP